MNKVKHILQNFIFHQCQACNPFEYLYIDFKFIFKFTFILCLYLPIDSIQKRALPLINIWLIIVNAFILQGYSKACLFISLRSFENFFFNIKRPLRCTGRTTNRFFVNTWGRHTFQYVMAISELSHILICSTNRRLLLKRVSSF
jgi:hypothetical protein